MGISSRTYLVATVLWVFCIGVPVAYFAFHTPVGKRFVETMLVWDAGHYLMINEAGYRLNVGPNGPEWEVSNCGWFPFYPLVGRLPALLVGGAWGQIITSWMTFWAGLVLMLHLVTFKFGARIATLAGIALVSFPTSFYFATGFPYSVYFLLSMMTFIFMEQRAYFKASLPVAALTVTYPSGAVICFAIAYWLLSRWHEHTVRQRLGMICCGASAVLALCGFGLWHYLLYGDALLFVHHQAATHAHKLAFPLVPLWGRMTFHGGDLSLETERVGIWFAIIAVAVVYQRRVPAPWQWQMFGVMLFTPTMGTTACYYRHIVVAWPLAVMAALCWETRRRAAYVFFVAASSLLYAFYFVPLFIKGQLS